MGSQVQERPVPVLTRYCYIKVEGTIKKARFACSTNRAQVLITPFRGEKFEGTLRTNLKTHREFDNYISFGEWARGSLYCTKLLLNSDLIPMEISQLSSFWTDQIFTSNPSNRRQEKERWEKDGKSPVSANCNAKQMSSLETKPKGGPSAMLAVGTERFLETQITCHTNGQDHGWVTSGNKI
jgi:hypothetical protein